ASEDYGWDLAWSLEAQYIPVDPSRSNIPVSASAIRANPFENWRFIPPAVRPWFLKHVAVIDDRSRAEALARDLNTVVVHPYHEFWQLTWNEFGGRREVAPLSPEQIRRGGRATIGALARQANTILIHDVRTAEDLAMIEELDVIIGNPPGVRNDSPLILAPAHADADAVRRVVLGPNTAGA
ncbi:MAG TPA: hypothetical protein VJ932_08145, partial [Alkalispirochaeta sp.]|nr:hypothetical protein [Alkalispirochaeta sp.]